MLDQHQPQHQRRFADRLRTKRFRYGAAALLVPALLCLGPATAWAEGSIVIDFVRHAQSADDAANILNTMAPGTELTATGDAQAQAVDALLAQQGSFAGIYASQLIRTQETAQPLVDALHLPLNPGHILSGLNEIHAGIFDGAPVYSPEGLLYLMAPMAWVFGAEFVPIPGSADANGIAFDESFGSAVQTIYDNTIVAPGASTPTDVAFSSEGAITTWALMNVKNPDFPLILTTLLKTGQFLPNTGVVVLQGDPQDGWTLVSFDGQPVPQDPGLPTEMFVDLRNLVEAPQFAAYTVEQAMLTGDPTTITNTIDAGIDQVETAAAQFPAAVVDDIVNTLGGSTVTAAADSVGTLATDLSGLLPGELGASIGAALASF